MKEEEDRLIGHPDCIVSVCQVLPLQLHGWVSGDIQVLHQLVLSHDEMMSQVRGSKRSQQGHFLFTEITHHWCVRPPH